MLLPVATELLAPRTENIDVDYRFIQLWQAFLSRRFLLAAGAAVSVGWLGLTEARSRIPRAVCLLL